MNILSKSLHHCTDFDYQGRSSRCELFWFSWFILAIWSISMIFYALLANNINQSFNFTIEITAELPKTTEFECNQTTSSQFSSSFKCKLPLLDFSSYGFIRPSGFKFDNRLFANIATAGSIVCCIAATTLLCLYSLILICIRRLHDCNSSGLWLVTLIPLPFLFPIFLLILWIVPPSSKNKYQNNLDKYQNKNNASPDTSSLSSSAAVNSIANNYNQQETSE